MKTSISSKAFCSITDRQTDKIFTEQMLIHEGNLHKKIGAISQLGAEKITFPPKPDGHTDRHRDIQSDRHTDGHLLLQSSCATKKKHHKYKAEWADKWSNIHRYNRQPDHMVHHFRCYILHLHNVAGFNKYFSLV